MMIPLFLIGITAAGLAGAASGAAADQGLLFHVPFDGDCTPAVAAGGGEAQGAETARFAAGKRGQAVVADGTLHLSYPRPGNLDKRRGTICLWVQPTWDGTDGKNHGFLADDIDFDRIEENNLYFWKWSVGTLRFDQRKDPSTYLTADVQNWKAGEWHHIAAAWDVDSGAWLFIDGEQVAARPFKWVVKESQRLLIGSNWRGEAPADCALDDLRIYGRPLTAGQVQAVMSGEELVTVTYHGLEAPDRVAVDQPFAVRVRASMERDIVWQRPVILTLDGLDLGRFTLPQPVPLRAGEPATLGPFEVVIPRYLYLSPGPHTLGAELAGSLAAGEENGRREIMVEVGRGLRPHRRVEAPRFTMAADGTVWCDGKPWLTGEAGVWYEGRFYGSNPADQRAIAALARSGRLLDAIPCRLVDEVDCTGTDHGFEEFGTSRVVALRPGKKFRLTGPAETVTQTREVYGRETRLLPAFSYRLKVAPRPTPHLLVVESLNDAERYLEVALDVAPGSRVAPHLRSAGLGRSELLNLGVAYTGREQGVDGQVFREYFLFFPKSDEILVTLCHSGHENDPPPEPGTPASHLWVYEFTASLSDLANPVPVPPRAPPRHVSLFYPHCPIMYEEYGFSAATEATRRSSIRVLLEYLRFMGFDRLEFHPYAFSPNAYFKSELFEPSGTADIFDDVLPLAAEMGIEVLPRVDSLVFFDKLWEGDEENYQHRKDGSIHDYFGKVPDPLRPQVQQVLLDVLREMLEKTRGYDNVPGVGFRANAKFGSLYVGSSPDAPPQETGYTAWDVGEFEKETGLEVAADHADSAACYEWIRDHCWEEWIGWRCRRIHDWWARARDLVQSYSPDKKLFVYTIIPYDHHFPSAETQWWGKGIDPLTQHRYHGYDPALYVDESGLVISRYINLDADRYNQGCVHNYPYWHDPAVPGLYRTREGTAVELYYIYWELPNHPRGFRVGPEWPVGRGWLEPLTHALRTMNVYSVTFYNWHRATTGREIGLREFCRAFRSLPAVPPRDFDGAVEPPPDERLWIRWFGNRLALVNDQREARTIRLTFPETLKARPRDLATNTLPPVDSSGCRVQIELRPFDVRVLALE